MTGWLKGKHARIDGVSPAIETALIAQGATIVTEGDCDIWIHVTQPVAIKSAHELTHSEWRECLDSGLDARFLGAKNFADQCRSRRQGGAILYVGAPEQALGADHAAAAGGLGNLTKTLGVEWARDGIRVNSILTHQTGESLGNLAAYMVSDYAAYVTGAVMGVGLDD